MLARYTGSNHISLPEISFDAPGDMTCRRDKGMQEGVRNGFDRFYNNFMQNFKEREAMSDSRRLSRNLFVSDCLDAEFCVKQVVFLYDLLFRNVASQSISLVSKTLLSSGHMEVASPCIET
jgi:hypothetical protein